MGIIEFTKSLSTDNPPQNISILAKALWFDGKGNWQKAHEIAQTEEGNYIYDRIHAYLHRKECDIFNAKYWYRRINLDFPKISLEEEWEELVEEYIKN